MRVGNSSSISHIYLSIYETSVSGPEIVNYQGKIVATLRELIIKFTESKKEITICYSLFAILLFTLLLFPIYYFTIY